MTLCVTPSCVGTFMCVVPLKVVLSTFWRFGLTLFFNLVSTFLPFINYHHWNQRYDYSWFIVFIALLRVIFNSVDNNPRLHWFCFTLLGDWTRKLAPISKPIRFNTKINHDLVSHVFLHFGSFLGLVSSSLWHFRVFPFHLIGLVIVLILVLWQSIEKCSFLLTFFGLILINNFKTASFVS